MGWKLDVGMHKGTMMSRDTIIVDCDDEYKPLETFDDCLRVAKEHQARYAGFGAYLWYAHAIAPDGTRHLNIIPGRRY